MGFDPLTMLSLASVAGGAGFNFLEGKDKEKDLRRMGERRQEVAQKNSAQAKKRWDESLAGLSRDAQEQGVAEDEAKRMAAYEQATADAPAATQLMNTGEATPVVVKTDAAKKLGDALAQMRSRMQAQARLGAWGDRDVATNIMLGRSGQEIADWRNKSAGMRAAIDADMRTRAADDGGPLGDILMGLGSVGLGAAAGGGAGPAGWLGDQLEGTWLTTPFVGGVDDPMQIGLQTATKAKPPGFYPASGTGGFGIY